MRRTNMARAEMIQYILDRQVYMPERERRTRVQLEACFDETLDGLCDWAMHREAKANEYANDMRAVSRDYARQKNRL